MANNQVLQVTLAIIKPHLVKRPCDVLAVRNIIISENFKIIHSCQKVFKLPELELFYAQHKHKFYYQRLLSSMLCGPSDFYVLARIDAINHWRKLLGPTKVYKAQISDTGSIRAQFGISDTRNAAHGSDSIESAKREIDIIFGNDFNLDKWYENDEMKFRLYDHNLTLNKKKFLHFFENRVKNC